MKARGWAVGVDFGGTSVRLGLIARDGRIRRRRRLVSRELGTPAEFVARLSEAIRALTRAQGFDPSRLAGLCVGAPGPVDSERGVVHELVNVPGWRRVPLAEQLERRLRCRCLVDNDVNLFTLGEWRFGAGRGAGQLIGITLGTGVGGGLVCEGALYRGASGAAGEVGHMLVDPRGRRCGCGQRGCLEGQIGTRAILARGRSALRHRRGILARLARQANGAMSAPLIRRAAYLGDPDARRVWTDVGRWLGLGLANLVHLLNPDRIVIGGGLSHSWRLFAPTAMAVLRERTFPIAAGAVQVVRGRLGDDAGMLGGAALVWGTLQHAAGE